MLNEIFLVIFLWSYKVYFDIVIILIEIVINVILFKI